MSDYLWNLRAPFSKEQVESMNEYQKSGVFHPFTCKDSNHRLLVAEEDGWHCPDCDYRQEWAHLWMTDNTWRGLLRNR